MIMNRRHINIPVFIPHLGCPNSCVFCNQRTISGVSEFDASSIIDIIENSLSTVTEYDNAEIAFFGGSFTGIDRELMKKLLYQANCYIKSGRITSIRCSTRPDYISDEVLDILERYGVKTIELGLQSISQCVLNACARGHTSEDSMIACKKIKERGFKLGAQMMIGLPGATIEDELKTAEFIVKSGADEARIYPTIVFKDTELCNMCNSGLYTPLSVKEAVYRASEVFKVLVSAKIKVLRIGLCDSENLHSDTTYFAGPNHPAMGELVIGAYYYNKIHEKLVELNIAEGAFVLAEVAKGQVSKAIGQSKINKNNIIREFSLSDFKVKESTDLKEYEVKVTVQERKKNVFKVT